MKVARILLILGSLATALSFAAVGVEDLSLLPITLTPEEDAALVAQGVLPPPDGTNAIANVRASEVYHLVKFTNATLFHVMSWYSDLTSLKVVGCEDLHARVTIAPGGPLTTAESLRAISNALAEIDIAIHPVSNDAVRVTYVGDARDALRKGVVLNTTSSAVQTSTTEVLQKHLMEYRGEASRLGLPPIADPRSQAK